MLYLLPEDREGALETLVLDALDDLDDLHKHLVCGARKFVKAEQIDGHFKKETPAAKDRLKEKAALGSALAVLSPDHSFQAL